jgi:DNA-directed RNA polymerase specialized sigma24 family protein
MAQIESGEVESLIEDRLVSQRGPHTEAYWDVELLKQRLAKRDWALLEGKYVIGYTDIELAEMLDCTKDSVRVMLSRARKKAREILLENYIDRGESNER